MKVAAREKLKALLDQRKAMKDLGNKIGAMGPNEFTDYISKAMANAPRKCGYCDYFSGNSEAPTVRPAWCTHKDLKGNEVDEDDDACGRFSLTHDTNLETNLADQVVIEDGYSLTEAEIVKRIASCDLFFPVHHEGLPAEQAMKYVRGVVQKMQQVGARVLHAHQYLPDGITNLLVKAPAGMSPKEALLTISNALLGVKGVNELRIYNYR